MRRTGLFAFLIAIALQGCGYKGPLYLPTGESAKPAATELPNTEQPANHQDNKQ